MTAHLNTTMDFIRKEPRVPLLITVVLALLMIFNLSQTLKTLTLHHDISSLSSGTSHVVKTIPDIADLHVFGHYKQNLADLPKTQLPLHLQGIEQVVASEQASRVLIADSNQPTKVYQVGDRVPGGAVVQHIFRDHVILNNNGRLENLYLPIPKIK